MSRTTEQTINMDKLIGKKITELRLSNGVSRQILAEAINVTHQQIQKYEHAQNRICASRLALIANFFKVDIKEFFEISEIENCEDKITNLRLSLEISRNLASINNQRFKETVNQLLRVYKQDQQN